MSLKKKYSHGVLSPLHWRQLKPLVCVVFGLLAAELTVMVAIPVAGTGVFRLPAWHSSGLLHSWPLWWLYQLVAVAWWVH